MKKKKNSWIDNLEIIKKTRKTPVKIYQTKIWLEFVLQSTNKTAKEFQTWYSGFEDSSNIVRKWSKGITCVTHTTVKRIANKLEMPETQKIYELPIYTLLENRRINEAEIKKIFSMYKVEPNKNTIMNLDGECTFWKFPNDNERKRKRTYEVMPFKDDKERLYRRGDIYSLIITLALAREAENSGDFDELILQQANAFRMIPSVCKVQPYKKLWKDLYQLLVAIQSRHLALLSIFRCDETIIEKHISNEKYSTIREEWPRSKNGRFIPPEDPVVFFNEV